MKHPIPSWAGRLALAAAVAFSLFMLPPACPSGAAADAPASPTGLKQTGVSLTAARIDRLHEKLNVLPEQEGPWREVARVMRDNAARMEACIAAARSRKEKGTTALEDLRAYGEIVKAHADGITAFIPVFAAFYNTLSEEQKAIVSRDDLKF